MKKRTGNRKKFRSYQVLINGKFQTANVRGRNPLEAWLSFGGEYKDEPISIYRNGKHVW